MSNVKLHHRTAQTAPKVVLVALAGEIDAGVDQAESYVREVLQAEQPQHLLLDLSGLTFASSPFFGSLLFWNEELDRRGGRLALCAVSSEVAYVLHVCSLDRALAIYPDEAAALAALNEPG